MTERAVLARALATIERLEARLSERERPAIAVVGAAGRFPGAPDLDALWALLEEGRDPVTEIPRERFEPGDGARHAALLAPTPFDAAAFGLAPGAAEGLDPQQRLLLELSFEALEVGAHPTSGLGDAGVFIGLYGVDHLIRGLGAEWDVESAVGSAHAFAAGRLAHRLGAHGPAMVVDTACSSSLVAVHLAMQSLRARETRLALAGGASLILAAEPHRALSRLGLLSRTGKTRPFDAEADGYVRGEGGGVVVLKRLADALADGDRIYAVLAGSAVNHNGEGGGLTVPNAMAERAVVVRALEDAGVAGEAVSYVECHALGSPLADVAEVDALREALGGRGPPCALGALKADLGHLEAAAGIAGLLKLLLCLERGRLPRISRLGAAHPELRLGRFVLPRELSEWSGERVAGLSAFGMSGTNAHLVVRSAPPVEVARADGPHAFVLSARTPEALRALGLRLAETLRGASPRTLADAAHTLLRRRLHATVAGFVATDAADLVAKLERLEPREAPKTSRPPRAEEEVALAGPNRAERILALRLEGVRLDPRRVAPGAVIALPTHPWIPAATAEPVEAAGTVGKLLALFRAKLGPGVAPTDDFREMGGTSIMAMELRDEINRAFGTELPISLFFYAPTIAELAENLDLLVEMADPELNELGMELPISRLVEHVHLDPSLRGRPAGSEWREVLLTGATGYYGSHLLASILERSAARVFCLVRAADAQAGLARILEANRKYAIPIDASRVVAVPGDLARLALPQGLEDLVDTVVHAGAIVNFSYPLESLLAANVEGLRALLAFVTRGRPKALHHVSTVGIFNSTHLEAEQTLTEAEPLRDLPTVIGGYAQSRWIGEEILLLAKERGVPVSIYRPSTIAGHRATGVSNEHDAIALLFKGNIQLGAAPVLSDTWNLVTADYAADGAIALALDPANLGGTFHLVNGHDLRFSALFESMRRFGYRLEALEYREWFARLKAAGSRNALYPLLPMIEHLVVAEVAGMRSQRFDDREARARLAPLGLVCPPIDDALVAFYLEAMIARGFIDPP